MVADEYKFVAFRIMLLLFASQRFDWISVCVRHSFDTALTHRLDLLRVNRLSFMMIRRSPDAQRPKFVTLNSDFQALNHYQISPNDTVPNQVAERQDPTGNYQATAFHEHLERRLQVILSFPNQCDSGKPPQRPTNPIQAASIDRPHAFWVQLSSKSPSRNRASLERS